MYEGTGLNAEFMGRGGAADDDYDYDEDDDAFDGGIGFGWYNDMDFFTWDQIIKTVPKLPQLDFFMHKTALKNKKFFLVSNEC